MGICLVTSAHQQINTTTLLRELWSCTDPHLYTYIHNSQQLYAMLAWVASMIGNATLTPYSILTELEKEHRGG